MITAGTVCAYLKLSVDDFRKSSIEALALLEQLRAASQTGAMGFAAIQGASAGVALALGGTLAPALSTLNAGLPAIITGCQTASGQMTAFGTASGLAAAGVTGVTVAAGAAAEQFGTQVSTSFSAASQTVQTAGGAMAAAMTGAAAAATSAFQSASTDTQLSGLQISAAMGLAAADSGAAMLGVADSVSVLAGAQTTASVLSAGICTGILAPITALKAQLRQAMVAAGDGMIAGLRSRKPAILALARSIAEQVRSTIESALEIASPSRVMRRIGAYTVEGLVLGMADMLPRAAQSAAAVAHAVERSAGVTLPAPSLAGILPPGAAVSAPAETAVAAPVDQTALCARIDRLLDYLSDTGAVMQLDGRTFARMVREYS